MSFDFIQFLAPDVLVACSVIVGMLLFVYTVGKYSIVPALTAIMTGAAFAAIGMYVNHLPVLGAWPEDQQRIALFVVVTLIAYVLYRRHTYFEPTVVPSGIELLICGTMLSRLVLAVLGSFFSPETIATLSPNLRLVFIDALPRTLWLISPVGTLAFMRGRM